MWKLSIYLLLAVNLVVFAVGYELLPTEKPTDTELWNWWQRLTPQEQLAELRKLDNVEHALPIVSGLDMVPILLDSGDLILTLQSPVSIKIDYLEYAITFSDQTVKGFYKPPKPKGEFLTVITWIGIGIVTGIIIDKVFK